MIKINYSKKIGIALCAFLSVGMFAQTAKEIGEIRKSNNLSGLEKIKKDLAKKPSVEELQTRAKKQNIPFRGEFEGKVYELKGFDSRTQMPQYYITSNAGAAAGTETDKLYNSAGLFNLQGQNMTLYEWDGGAVRVSHQEFGGRVTQADNSRTLNDHATHVAGTLVGNGTNAAAKGMAFQANLRAYDWTNDTAEVIDAAANGALVSNHSYGYIGAFEWGNWSGNTGWHWLGTDEETEYMYYGKYTEYDQAWDEIAANAPHYLQVKAAGNPRGDGPEPGGLHYVRVTENGVTTWVESHKVRQKNGGEEGFDSINHSALGKNILTVGAVHKLANYNRPEDVVMTSFSAFGPADDGRVKPDIVGVGQAITSAVTSSDTAYGIMNGTSMASPNVTGSIALLQQHHNELYGSFMKAATLKALIINTAKEAGNIGPDYKFGWGLLDALKAAQTLSVKSKLSLIEERTLNNAETQTLDLVADGAEPLKVTIAWTDPKPTTLPDINILNDRQSVLVNDLDIKILKNGEEFLPWILNPATPNAPATKGDNIVDNVEQIVIDSPEAGATYQLVVSHKNTLANNSQDFSIVATGVKQDLEYDLAINKVSIDEIVNNYSANTPVSFTYENKGTKTIASAKINYKLINKDDNDAVEQEGSIDITNLQPGTPITHSVAIDLSKSFVNYEITGEVEFADDTIDVNNKVITAAYGIVADLTEENSYHNYGFETNVAKDGWSAENTDGNNETWKTFTQEGLQRSGNRLIVNISNEAENINDWLFSNPLRLKKGEEYRAVIYIVKVSYTTEPVQLFLGRSANSGAMTTAISPIVEANTGNYTKYSFDFTPDDDGIFYVGYQQKLESGGYAILMDDVSFQYAKSKPFAEFSVSKFKPNTYETVTLTDETSVHNDLPIISREWTITPNTYELQDGTTLASENPKLILRNEGAYTVSLKVTNSKGEDSITKTDYIIVGNTATVANFTNSNSKIYENETVTFTNASTGNPAPNAIKWTITPSEGFEYMNGTNDTHRAPIVKFTKKGVYDVSLTATSLHNTHTVEKKNLVEVSGVYNGVRNLSYTLDNGNGDLQLNWVKPERNPIYTEDFNTDVIPAEMTVINESANATSWIMSSQDASGNYYTMSLSWPLVTRNNTQNWLVTPKLRAGAEVLEYKIANPNPERYDIFVVEAPENGANLTTDMIRAGHKILTEEGQETLNTFTPKSIDIREYTEKDFYVAFLHRTLLADNGYLLALDDIKVGYDNSIP
ncbi:MAG: S8 family serine peptidase, partial [Cruoricaptor ignavus]|nr:S8 family serine peptidase [Cruoricaptor ignavus]